MRAPVDDRLTAPLEHGDVERLDLHLLDDDRSAPERLPAPVALSRGNCHGWREFAFQSLQRPRTRLGDRCRDRRQRHDPSDVGDGAGEGEARDVVLDTARPGDEGRRLGEANVAVGRDQAAARERLSRLENHRGGNTHAGKQELAHLGILQTGSHRAETETRGTVAGFPMGAVSGRNRPSSKGLPED